MSEAEETAAEGEPVEIQVFIAASLNSALNNCLANQEYEMEEGIIFANGNVLRKGKTHSCSCEQACPQHLTIREYLKDVAAKFESKVLPVKK